MTNAAKTNNAYIYSLEVNPVLKSAVIATILNGFDIFTLISLSIYYRYISRNWLYFYIAGFVGTCLSFVAVILMPESPLYLHSKS